MNFQAVKQANGNNVTMFGTFNEVGGVSLTQNQKEVCKCQIIDDNSEKHLVRLYGTMPGPAVLNTRHQFTLSTYSGKTQQGQLYTGYSGFWNNKAQTAPQNAQQGTQQPAQSTNPPQPDNWDVVLRTRVVCAYIASGKKPLVEDIEYWMKYCKTGIDASLPQNVNPKYAGGEPEDDRPAKDGDVPF